MTYIFKGMEIVLANGNKVIFDSFKKDGFTKIGFYDIDGNEYPMSDLYTE